MRTKEQQREYRARWMAMLSPEKREAMRVIAKQRSRKWHHTKGQSPDKKARRAQTSREWRAAHPGYATKISRKYREKRKRQGNPIERAREHECAECGEVKKARLGKWYRKKKFFICGECLPRVEPEKSPLVLVANIRKLADRRGLIYTNGSSVDVLNARLACLDEMLSSLSEREQSVLRGLYFQASPVFLKEIGRKWKITPQRVLQIKNKALRKLKTRIREKEALEARA